MTIKKLREIHKSHFGRRLANKTEEHDNTAKREPKESFAEVLEREKGKLREE